MGNLCQSQRGSTIDWINLPKNNFEDNKYIFKLKLICYFGNNSRLARFLTTWHILIVDCCVK